MLVKCLMVQGAQKGVGIQLAQQQVAMYSQCRQIPETDEAKQVIQSQQL